MAIVTKATKRLLKLNKRLRFIAGGTSASKTYSILMILIDYAQTNKNEKIDVVSESIPHLDDGAIRDFKGIMVDRNYWNDSRWNSTLRIYKFESGTEIKFKSVDKLGKSRGPRRDGLFLNECDNIPFDIADQLIVRTKKFIWADFNPTHEFWYYTDIKDKRDHDFLTLTYKDCLDALDPRIVEDIESHKWNKNWWKVYGLGQLGDIEGRIYTHWDLIDEIPDGARLERYGLDFGYTNDPTAIVAIWYANGKWIFDECVYKKGMSNKDIVDTLKQLIEGDKQLDRLVMADSAEPKSIDEIKAYGINIMPCKKGKDSVRQGIQLVQDQPIAITKRSVNVIKEYRNYLWAQDKDGKYIQPNEPVKGNDHGLDAIRYAMETLGRLKKEVEYWDRIFEEELNYQAKEKTINKGR